MKKWWAVCFVAFFQGSAIYTNAMSIARWGKVSPVKEGILVSSGVILSVIAVILWNRYPYNRLPDEGIAAKPGSLFERYPQSSRYLSLVAGVFIFLALYSLLGFLV